MGRAAPAAFAVFAFFGGATLLAPGSASADLNGSKQRLSSGLVDSNSPAISGSQVVWTNVDASNYDIYLYEITTGLGAPLTTTLNEQEWLEDIDSGNAVWTHASTSRLGDIVLYETATGKRTPVAVSSPPYQFQQPSIRGRWITYLRVSDRYDVDLYDVLGTGLSFPVTDDPAVQANPRVGGDHVVFEDYNSGNADVFAAHVLTPTVTFPVAAGPGAQTFPDIDGNTIVYVDDSTGTDHIWAYDLVSGSRRQLTSAASNKMQPRISGSRVVWSDDRLGTLDLYLYDLSTNLEHRLVWGPGDQWLSDIDGNRIVYTDNLSTFDEVWLFTIDSAPPPPAGLPYGCNPTYTTAVSSPVTLARGGFRPVYADGSYTEDDPKDTYWVCIENGKPDGSARATQVLFTHDRKIVLTPSQFKPNANPPRWVAARLSAKALRARWARMSEPNGQHAWTAALYGRNPPNQITITIRKSN